MGHIWMLAVFLVWPVGPMGCVDISIPCVVFLSQYFNGWSYTVGYIYIMVAVLLTRLLVLLVSWEQQCDLQRDL